MQAAQAFFAILAMIIFAFLLSVVDLLRLSISL